MSTEAVIDQHNNTRYHEYIEYLGDICLATEALDKRIRVLRKYVGKTFTSKADAESRMKPALNMAQDILNRTNPLDENIRMGDYFRLMAHANLAAEMILAPSVFASNDMDARIALADGTTGTAATIVENALDIYHQAETNNYNVRSQSSGIIAEFSTIALVNLAEDGTSIMLPSSQYSDMFDKIDADYYGIVSEDISGHKRRVKTIRSKPFRTSVQIKGTRRPMGGTTGARELEKNDHAAYIFASDFNNLATPKQQFPVSKLLVSEMNGVDEIEYQREVLAEQSRNIQDTIHRQKNALNTEEL